MGVAMKSKHIQIFIIILVSLFYIGFLQGADYEGKIIKAINVKRIVKTEKSSIDEVIVLKKGSELKLNDLNQSVSNISKLKKYNEVKIEIIPADDQVDVTFIVQEVPVVKEIIL